MKVIHLEDEKEFKELIKEDKILVDFFANWCGPCKMISPIVEEISNEISDVKFLKVDVDSSSEVASTYSIMSIPTLMIFKDGQIKSKTVGFINKEGLINFINENK